MLLLLAIYQRKSVEVWHSCGKPMQTCVCFVEMWKFNSKKIVVKPMAESPTSSFSTPPSTVSPLQAVIDAKPAIKFSFFDSVKLVYRVGRLFGLLPFTLNYKLNGEIDSCRLRIIDILWFVITVALCMASSVLGYSALTPTQDNRTTFLLFGGRIVLIGGVSLAAISIVMDFFNRHRLVELVKSINSFDQEVMQKLTFVLNLRRFLIEQKVKRL